MANNDGVMMGMAACFACAKVFGFDPDRVPSISIRLGTGRGTPLPPESCPQGPCDSCTREPVCPACARKFNPQRRAAGLEPIYEGDTLEDLAHGHPRAV